MRVEHEQAHTRPLSDPLVGHTVRIYRDGPEARTGVLLAVRSDFIALKTARDGVVYYVIEHIQSISEDAEDSTPRIPFSVHELDLIEEEEFEELLHSMKHRYVKIDRGGPESRVGRLVHLACDHLVLATADEGVIYYNLEHIRSISEVLPLTQEKGNSILPHGAIPRFLRADDMDELFRCMKYQWVKVNRGGPEHIEGVLVEAREDQIMVINDHRVHRVSTYHLRSISMTNPIFRQEEKREEDSSSSSVGSSSSNSSSDRESREESDERIEQYEKRMKLELEEREQLDVQEVEELERELERVTRAGSSPRPAGSRSGRATKVATTAKATGKAMGKTDLAASSRLEGRLEVPSAKSQRSKSSALSQIRGGSATRVYFMNR